MDTERCADFAVAHNTFAHSKDFSAEASFIRVTQITFG
jgi:hypothetical protein